MSARISDDAFEALGEKAMALEDVASKTPDASARLRAVIEAIITETRRARGAETERFTAEEVQYMIAVALNNPRTSTRRVIELARELRIERGVPVDAALSASTKGGGR